MGGAIYCSKGQDSNIFNAKYNSTTNTYSTSGSVGIVFCKEKFSQDCWDYPGGGRDREYATKQIDYTTPTMGSSCNSYLNYTKEATEFDSSNKKTVKDYAVVGGKSNNRTGYCLAMVTQQITMSNKNTLTTYFNKWNTFFNTKENGNIFTKATKAAISSQTKKEGVVTNTLDKISSTNNYLAHFIYAAIDTSFEKR
ncbi:MAG: hypothetical protein L6V95_00745 [Candidatus Melainabacteria bacterium]|nr:MAG: hypothetical protein L6V95_00745 [Candidatus Melainabacteria bacterium]